MERKRALKKAGGDATDSAEKRGDPQTQGEEAPLPPKPHPGERTWQVLLVYSSKALYKRKYSLQSPRLKRRKSRRSLLLKQNQLVAKKNGNNCMVTFCKKNLELSYQRHAMEATESWQNVLRLAHHEIALATIIPRTIWSPSPGATQARVVCLKHLAVAATSNWTSWPQPRTHRKFVIATSTKVAIIKVKIHKLPPYRCFLQEEAVMHVFRMEKYQLTEGSCSQCCEYSKITDFAQDQSCSSASWIGVISVHSDEWDISSQTGELNF